MQLWETLHAVTSPARCIRTLRVGQYRRFSEKGTVKVVEAVQRVTIPVIKHIIYP